MITMFDRNAIPDNAEFKYYKCPKCGEVYSDYFYEVNGETKQMRGCPKCGLGYPMKD